MRVQTIIVCLVIAYFSATLGECPNGCDKHTFLYESIGCIPKYKNSTDCCPKEYDCSVIDNTPSLNCHFHGLYYKEHDPIPNSLTELACETSCVCEQAQTFSFNCGATHCATYLNVSTTENGCYLRYDLDKCCSTGVICPPFNGLEKCDVNGKTYNEGERFWPEPCKTCVCKKGLGSEFREPFCKKTTCFDELYSMEQIDKSYAPYYLHSKTCCPSGWLEPGKDDQVIVLQGTLEPKCRFGTKNYEIGENFITTIRKNDFLKQILKCSCEIPPLLTCTITGGVSLPDYNLHFTVNQDINFN